jgi:porphobilinogen synthase
MIRNAVDMGMMQERAIYESIIGICRSGANIVITYFAKEAAKVLNK